jgi:hypothetical protein
MKKIFLSFFVTLVVSLQSLSAQNPIALHKVWETPEGLNVPESSHYNVFDRFIYVSNVVGKPDAKDSVGYISKLDTKGHFVQKEWFSGLNAPKGIACTATHLYVTDINRVVEIDLKTAKIRKEYRNSKSRSLNDISISPDGRVFVSDSGGNCIFVVSGDSLAVFLESAQLKSMNGILATKDRLFLGSKGNFISIDSATKELRVECENVGYLDGIVQIAGGKFITSNWQGKIQLIESGKGAQLLLDTTPLKINAADLGYIPSKKLLLVPTFYLNTVVAYRLK